MQNFLLGFVILSTVLPGEIITFNSNWHTGHGFRLISETPSGVEVVFSVKQLVIDDVQINDIPMKTVSIPGVFLPNNEGAPNLPGMGRYIAIPQSAQARVIILSEQTKVYHNIDIVPAHNIPLETDTMPLRYKKDMAIYGRNAYYPDNPVILSKPMKIRGVDVVILGITPFQYNPVTKELIVYKDLRVRVDFIGGNGHFGKDRLRSLYWEPILQGHLLNYKSLPTIDFCRPRQQRDGYEYIIIVPDDSVFEAWADTIKNWRKLQGISTEVFTLTEVGGSTPEAIEAFIDSAYNNWTPAPVAVLLLSDHPSSGDYYGIPTTAIGDNKYADTDGDSLPEINIARITAQTGTHLNIMINKFLSYERAPYTDPGFYDHPLVSCAYYLPRWFQLTSEILRGFLINELTKDPARQYGLYGGMGSKVWSTAPNTELLVAYFGESGLCYIPDSNYYIDSAGWWWNGSAAGINNAINAGAFIIQYRDHGSETGWAEPPYHINDLAGLNNAMYPFAILVSSLNGNYTSANPCFVEVLHRMQHGSLGAIAASGVIWSYVSDIYNLGVFDGLWPVFDPGYPLCNLSGYENLRPGFANVSGKYYLASHAWASNPEHKTIIYGLYHMHGDAFTTLYSEIPESLSVFHSPWLIAGATSFTVQADDSSVIALTVDGEIIGVAEGTGAPIPITIPPQSPPDIMKVTVTKANYYRYEKDVPVVVGVEENYLTTQPVYIKINPVISRDRHFVLQYSINAKTPLDLKVYNVSGSSVYYQEWKELNGDGELLFSLSDLAQGVYFVRMRTTDRIGTDKVVLLR